MYNNITSGYANSYKKVTDTTNKQQKKKREEKKGCCPKIGWLTLKYLFFARIWTLGNSAAPIPPASYAYDLTSSLWFGHIMHEWGIIHYKHRTFLAWSNTYITYLLSPLPYSFPRKSTEKRGMCEFLQLQMFYINLKRNKQTFYPTNMIMTMW